MYSGGSAAVAPLGRTWRTYASCESAFYNMTFNATETLTPAFCCRIVNVNLAQSFNVPFVNSDMKTYALLFPEELKNCGKSSRHFNLHEQSRYKHGSFQPLHCWFCMINDTDDYITSSGNERENVKCSFRVVTLNTLTLHEPARASQNRHYFPLWRKVSSLSNGRKERNA